MTSPRPAARIEIASPMMARTIAPTMIPDDCRTPFDRECREGARAQLVGGPGRRLPAGI